MTSDIRRSERLPSAAKNSATGDQVTQFIYGTTLSDSDVASNELLRTKIYPDDTTGVPDRETFAYNRLGQMKLLTDQNGTTRELTYDKLGRRRWTPSSGDSTAISWWRRPSR